MNTYTFHVFRDGEYVESVGVTTHSESRAWDMLETSGYSLAGEEIKLVSTS